MSPPGLPPMRVRVAAEDGTVLADVSDDDGLLRASVAGTEHSATSPEDLALNVAPMMVVAELNVAVLLNGKRHFPCVLSLAIRAAEGGVQYRAHLDQPKVTTTWRDFFLDVVLDDLRSELRPKGVLRTCAGCKWSDYPPRSSAGSLHCFVDDSEAYLRAAISRDPDVRRRGAWDRTRPVAVSEFHACDHFEPRPPGLGHRG